MNFDDSDFSSDVDIPGVGEQRGDNEDDDDDDFADDSDFTESETPSPPKTPEKGARLGDKFAANPPRAVWEFTPPLQTTVWSRESEWDGISPAMVFASPLASGPVDLWIDSDAHDEAILLYKTPEGYLGKMLAKKTPDATSVVIKYKTENTLIPTRQYPPMSEGEVMIPLIAYQEATIKTYLDVSLGGYAHDPRHYRRAIKERSEDDPVILPPDMAILKRTGPHGDDVVFASPCRGMLLHVFRSSPKLLQVMRLAQESASDDNNCVDNHLHSLYNGLRRHISETTHFNEEQIDDVWNLFKSSSASGQEDLDCGLEVYLTLEELPAFITKLLPADKLGDDAETHAQARTFLQSNAFVEGLWWMISSPLGGASYNASSPASKRANRKANFCRVMEVLNVAMFGVKDHIVEFLIHLLTPGDPSSLPISSFKAFFASAFPSEDASELAELFEDMFIDGVAPFSLIRYTLTEMDVFQTWNAIILPLLEFKGWTRQNPNL